MVAAGWGVQCRVPASSKLSTCQFPKRCTASKREVVSEVQGARPPIGRMRLTRHRHPQLVGFEDVVVERGEVRLELQEEG